MIPLNSTLRQLSAVDELELLTATWLEFIHAFLIFNFKVPLLPDLFVYRDVIHNVNVI